MLTEESQRTCRKTVPVVAGEPQIPHGLDCNWTPLPLPWNAGPSWCDHYTETYWLWL